MLWLMSIRCSSGNSAHFFWLSATGLGASEPLMNRLSVLTGRLRSIAFISSIRLSSDVSSEGLQRDRGAGFMNQSSADVRWFSRLSSCSGVGFSASAIAMRCLGRRCLRASKLGERDLLGGKAERERESFHDNNLT